MVTVLLIAVAVLALLVGLLFAALVEMYRDLRQVRDAIGILDRPVNIDIESVAGTRPGEYGLPRALDSAGTAIVLFLSERCATCHQLAAGLPKPLPAALWVVFEARTAASAAALLERYGLASHPRVVTDAGGEIAASLGLHITPAGFRVENGVITFATSVPSTRYLTSILPETFRLREAG
jgi:hypothetical protein